MSNQALISKLSDKIIYIHKMKTLLVVLTLVQLCHNAAFHTGKVNQQISGHTSVALIPRRKMLETSAGLIVAIGWIQPSFAEVQETRDLIRTSIDQLTSAPAFIEREQWDNVRALLLKPPLSECWNKRQPLLVKYAQEVGEEYELDVLELKEEVASHLRYLDMAVYNNVFNPIKTEGETGATKQLIKSYYEDPINEYKASLTALQSLLSLGQYSS